MPRWVRSERSHRLLRSLKTASVRGLGLLNPLHPSSSDRGVGVRTQGLLRLQQRRGAACRAAAGTGGAAGRAAAQRGAACRAAGAAAGRAGEARAAQQEVQRCVPCCAACASCCACCSSCCAACSASPRCCVLLRLLQLLPRVMQRHAALLRVPLSMPVSVPCARPRAHAHQGTHAASTRLTQCRQLRHAAAASRRAAAGRVGVPVGRALALCAHARQPHQRAGRARSGAGRGRVRRRGRPTPRPCRRARACPRHRAPLAVRMHEKLWRLALPPSARSARHPERPTHLGWLAQVPQAVRSTTALAICERLLRHSAAARVCSASVPSALHAEQWPGIPLSQLAGTVLGRASVSATPRPGPRAGGWALDPRSPVLRRAGAAAAGGEAGALAPAAAHLFAFPLESNFSGARCALPALPACQRLTAPSSRGLVVYCYA